MSEFGSPDPTKTGEHADYLRRAATEADSPSTGEAVVEWAYRFGDDDTAYETTEMYARHVIRARPDGVLLKRIVHYPPWEVSGDR